MKSTTSPESIRQRDFITRRLTPILALLGLAAVSILGVGTGSSASATGEAAEQTAYPLPITPRDGLRFHHVTCDEGTPLASMIVEYAAYSDGAQTPLAAATDLSFWASYSIEVSTDTFREGEATDGLVEVARVNSNGRIDLIAHVVPWAPYGIPNGWVVDQFYACNDILRGAQ